MALDEMTVYEKTADEMTVYEVTCCQIKRLKASLL